jgi:hypothetical protein
MFMIRARRLLAAISIAAAIAALSTPSRTASGRSTPIPDEAASAALRHADSESSDWSKLSSTETKRLLVLARRDLKTDSGLKVDPTRATAWMIGRGIALLRTPLAAAGGLVRPSARVLTLRMETGQVISTAEMAFRATSASSGSVRAWANGTLRVDRVVTAIRDIGNTSVMSASFHSQAAPAATFGSSKWWSTLNACLAAQGIPAWVVASLSLICGAVCVGTAGVGCVLCLAAASGFAGGVIGACVNAANKA